MSHTLQMKWRQTFFISKANIVNITWAQGKKEKKSRKIYKIKSKMHTCSIGIWPASKRKTSLGIVVNANKLWFNTAFKMVASEQA